MNQLVDAKRAHFPAVLTYKKACDWSVITMLRGRTLGNSSSALRNSILEIHSEEWLRKNLIYPNDCKTHRSLTGIHTYVLKNYKKHVQGRMYTPELANSRIPRAITISQIPQRSVCYGRGDIEFVWFFLVVGFCQCMWRKCGVDSRSFLQQPQQCMDQF